METNIANCSIGIKLDEDCHRKSFCRTAGLKGINDFEEEEVQLICWRSGIEQQNLKDVCYHHEQTILVRYSKNITVCCNPFNLHDTNKKQAKRKKGN